MQDIHTRFYGKFYVVDNRQQSTTNNQKKHIEVIYKQIMMMMNNSFIQISYDYILAIVIVQYHKFWHDLEDICDIIYLVGIK